MYATDLNKIVNIRRFYVLESISKGKRCLIQIAKETHFTYSRMCFIINLFEDMNLIETKKNRRKRMVMMKLKGWQVYHMLQNIIFPTEKDSLSFFSPKDS